MLKLIETTHNFMEKFFISYMSFNKLKIELHKFQHLGMKSSDFNDILNALLIILLVLARIKYLWSHLMMIEDYMKIQKDFEKEKEIIIRFKVSLYFFFLFKGL